MITKQTPTTALAPRTEPGMTRWSPWSEFATLRHQMDDLFSRAFGYTPLSRLMPEEGFAYEPPFDIYTNDKEVMLCAALPGYTPDQIDVQAAPEVITIHGERKAIYDADKTVPERQSGMLGESRFQIHCTLPVEINPNAIKATFHNGILELKMPKTEQAKSKEVKVKVQPA